MKNVSIRAIRIQDLTSSHDLLAGYRDPHRYLRRVSPAWIELLRTNPFAQPTDLALVLAIDDDTVVGRLGFYAGEVALNQRRFRTCWLQGFFLDERYRTSGAGGMLILPAISSFKCLIGAGGPSPELVKLVSALGFHQLGPLRRFIHFYRSNPIVERFLRQGALSRLLATAANPLLKLYNWRSTRRASRDFTITYKPVNKFDDGLDELLAKETRHFFPRGAATLNWILSHLPREAFEIHGPRGLLGYAIFKQAQWEAIAQHNLPPMRVGSLQDYYLPADAIDAKRDLLLFSIDHFVDRDVDLLECQVFDRGMPELCRQLGMLEKGGHVVNFKPPRGENLIPEETWFLTLGTGDVILE